ncbi:MAG: chemotaxis protein CheW [Proteobacteria bacterium]|nr:MAG: chemotaxis protein CheW [Pseudomonadota bacterium]
MTTIKSPNSAANFTRATPGQYLTFVLNSQMYGVPISAIREINRVTEITPVPQTPIYYAGVMNLRGKVISVVDLRLKFHLNSSAHTRQTCIIVIEGNDNQVGMIVDSISGVIDLTDGQIEVPPTMGKEDPASYVTGMGKLEDSVLILLDIVKCLSQEEDGPNLAEFKLAS